MELSRVERSRTGLFLYLIVLIMAFLTLIMVLSWTRRDPARDGDIDLRSSWLRPAAPNPQAPNRDI